MPSIEVSPEQHAYVMALRDELSEQITYGHVRTEDAVQYLIDHHRNDGEVDVEVDGEIDPGAGTGAGATGGSAGGGSTGGELDIGDGLTDPGASSGGATVRGGIDDGTGDTHNSEDGTDEEAAGVGGDTDSDDEAGANGTTVDGESGEGADSPSVVESAAALGGGGPGSVGDDGDGGDDSEDAEESGDDMVSEMMQLLDAHREKWSETDGSQGKYEVELPDGGSETAMTKDDVRALLFQHYR